MIIGNLVGNIKGLGCFDTKFPWILGGLQGDTIFHSFDIDQYQSIVIGGQTSDPGIASIDSIPDPIALSIESGGRVLWAVSFSNQAQVYDMITHIAFEESL